MADSAAQQKYDDEKNQIAMALFREALHFAQIDNKINASLASLMESAAQHVKENPKAFESGKGLEEVLRGLKAGRDDHHGPATTGGDTVGGSVIGDIVDLLEGAADLIKDEKEFFLAIIKLIFCGC